MKRSSTMRSVCTDTNGRKTERRGVRGQALGVPTFKVARGRSLGRRLVATVFRPRARLFAGLSVIINVACPARRAAAVVCNKD